MDFIIALLSSLTKEKNKTNTIALMKVSFYSILKQQHYQRHCSAFIQTIFFYSSIPRVERMGNAYKHAHILHIVCRVVKSHLYCHRRFC
jgi:hypothetical protein